MKAKRVLKYPAAVSLFFCLRDAPETGWAVGTVGWMAASGTLGDVAGAAEPEFLAV